MSEPLVSLVLPVYNEEEILTRNVRMLLSFLLANLPYRFEMVIAENGSNDHTLEIAHQLKAQHPAVQFLSLPQKGRGRALNEAWSLSHADILSYMDADLATDIHAFPALIEPLVNGRCDLAIGSRLLRPELTTRGFKRELLSRDYNVLLKSLLQAGFSDAQCGFKAITRKAANELLPLVKNTDWFFDTELLVWAQKLNRRIFELPVSWIENRPSHVRVLRTIAEDLRGIFRLKRRLGCTPCSHCISLSPNQSHVHLGTY
jgi:glycosyltransferase involved in cell wall biosynthesis